MAKLYWRVKRDGKWTWVAATLNPDINGIEELCCVLQLEDSE